jgi:hypothetical protein
VVLREGGKEVKKPRALIGRQFSSENRSIEMEMIETVLLVFLPRILLDGIENFERIFQNLSQRFPILDCQPVIGRIGEAGTILHIGGRDKIHRFPKGK